MKVAIKPMRRENVKDCLKLIRDNIGPKDAKYAGGVIERIFSGTEKWWKVGYFVALIEDKVVGMIGYYESPLDPADIFWVGWYAVRKDMQKKGIGRLLMEHLFGVVKGMKAKYLCVYMQESSTNRISRFYSKFGFAEKGRIENYFENGDDMVYMAKRF